jgi:quinol monooxygenase YgiN
VFTCLVTLINVFETTPEQQQALIEQWIRLTEEVKKEPGYLGTALHRSKSARTAQSPCSTRSKGAGS